MPIPGFAAAWLAGKAISGASAWLGGNQRQQKGLPPTVTLVVTMGARYTGTGA